MKNIRPKSKEMIQEATDIILNTEDDEAAIAFLKETLVDDFPDLDLGKMDLHKAIEVLGGDNKKKNKRMQTIENLNKSLGDFIYKTERNKKKAKKRKKR